MKRIFLILFSLSLILNAGTTLDKKAKKEMFPFSQFDYKVTLNKVMKSDVIKTYMKETGMPKATTKEDLRVVLKNKNFKKALYELYFTKSKYSVDYGKKMTVYMPNYPKVLKYLAKAVEETNNPIAGWIGQDIVVNNYMNVAGHPIAKKYLRLFSKPLKDRNICEGYLFYGKSFFKNFAPDSTPNYARANNILAEGLNKCRSKKTIPNFILYTMKLTKGKAHAMYKITKGQ